MNETKHTPRPWTATPSYINLGEWEIYGNEDGDNAQHIGSIEAEGTEQAEANARLIAAAPDLLAACELSAYAEAEAGYGPGTPEQSTLSKECLTAIAKMEAKS